MLLSVAVHVKWCEIECSLHRDLELLKYIVTQCTVAVVVAVD